MCPGGQHGQLDSTTEAGYSVEYVSEKVISCLVSSDRQLVLAPLYVKIGIIIRTVWPALYRYIMNRRAIRERKNIWFVKRKKLYMWNIVEWLERLAYHKGKTVCGDRGGSPVNCSDWEPVCATLFSTFDWRQATTLLCDLVKPRFKLFCTSQAHVNLLEKSCGCTLPGKLKLKL